MPRGEPLHVLWWDRHRRRKSPRSYEQRAAVRSCCRGSSGASSDSAAGRVTPDWYAAVADPDQQYRVLIHDGATHAVRAGDQVHLTPDGARQDGEMDGRGAGGDLVDPADTERGTRRDVAEEGTRRGGNRFFSGSVRQSLGYGYPARISLGARTMSHPDDATQPHAGPSGALPPYQPMYPPPPPPPIPPGPPVNDPAVRGGAAHHRRCRRARPRPARARVASPRARTALAVACFLVAAALVGYTDGRQPRRHRPRSAVSRRRSRSPTSPAAPRPTASRATSTSTPSRPR